MHFGRLKTLVHYLWHVVSVFVLFYLSFLSRFLVSFFDSFLLPLLSDRFFICPVVEVAVTVDLAVVVMGLQDVQSQNYEKKVYYNEEQGGKKRGAQLFPEKKEKNPSSTTSVPFKLSSFTPLRRRR